MAATDTTQTSTDDPFGDGDLEGFLAATPWGPVEAPEPVAIQAEPQAAAGEASEASQPQAPTPPTPPDTIQAPAPESAGEAFPAPPLATPRKPKAPKALRPQPGVSVTIKAPTPHATPRSLASYATREAWLLAAVDAMRPWLDEQMDLGACLPPVVHVSVGFPKGTSGRQRAIGQCWAPTTSADGNPHLFICPTLQDASRVLDVLLHELAHAALPTGVAHKAPFRRVAEALGLCKPWTATTASPELTTRLDALASALGAYPHAALTLAPKGKVGTRMCLVVCACGRKLRAARKTIDMGPLMCGLCETLFVDPETGEPAGGAPAGGDEGDEPGESGE